MPTTVTTPEEFLKQMLELKAKRASNSEMLHIDADELLSSMLIELGYGKGVDVYDSMEKWYS